MMLLSWSALVKSLLLLLISLLFLSTISCGCINYATVKTVTFCIILYMGVCVSIKKKKHCELQYLKEIIFMVNDLFSFTNNIYKFIMYITT